MNEQIQGSMPDVEQGIAQADTAQATATTATETKPKASRRRGRGLTNEVVATSRLKFKPKDADPSTGLFQAHLESVEVRYSSAKEDSTARPSFAGLEVPYIVFTFASNEHNVAHRKYVTLNFSAVESNANTIPGGSEDWKVDQVLRYLKHFLDVYVLRGAEMPAEMEDALTLPFEDFDEEGFYVAVSPEEVVKGWGVVLENYANLMNTHNNGKPAFVNITNGSFIPVWIKLLASVKGKQGWKNINRGELTFPTFTGEGVIEKAVNGVTPVIRINAINESVVPKVIEEAKAPTQLPTTGAMIGGGIMAPMGGADMVGVAGVADDMPFGESPF